MSKPQLDTPEGTRFLREKYKTSVGDYTATFAILFEGTKVKVGASFCSPKDCFSKVRGRVRAVRKLTKLPVELPLSVEEYLALEGKERKRYLVTVTPCLMTYAPQRVTENTIPLSFLEVE